MVAPRDRELMFKSVALPFLFFMKIIILNPAYYGFYVHSNPFVIFIFQFLIFEFSAKIAKVNTIRKILKKYQLSFIKRNRKCCIEGRDISTKILPKAKIKFFFICNLNIASIRRFKELKKFNPSLRLSDVKKALRTRNIIDTNRKNSPLLKHADSVVINTGKLSKQAMLKKMSKYIDSSISE